MSRADRAAVAMILERWDQRIAETRGVTVNLPLDEVEAGTAWLAGGRQRQLRLRRRLVAAALETVEARIPWRNTKKLNMASCCRHNLVAVQQDLQALLQRQR